MNSQTQTIGPSALRPRLGVLAVIAVLATVSFAQTRAAQTPAARPAGAKTGTQKATAPAAPAAASKANMKGPADAPIKVVEFADFMCPGCQAASGALRAYFAQQGPDINLTFKNFPLELACNPGIGRTVHNGACELALGSICAADQGLFWPYHDRIFSRAWEVATRQDVLDNGVAAGLNKAKLETCMNSADAKSRLALQIKEGFETPVNTTPTLVVNGKKLEVTNQFASVVEEERKKLAAAKAK